MVDGVSCCWGEDPQQMMGPGTVLLVQMPSKCPSNSKNHQKPKTSPGFLHLHQLQSQAPACYDQASAQKNSQLASYEDDSPEFPSSKNIIQHHPDTERRMIFSKKRWEFWIPGGMTISLLNYPIFRRNMIASWCIMVHPHRKIKRSNHRCFPYFCGLAAAWRAIAHEDAALHGTDEDPTWRGRRSAIPAWSEGERRAASSAGLIYEHIKYHDGIHIYIYII